MRKKLICFFALLVFCITYLACGVQAANPEEEYLAKAIATSYGELSYGGKIGVAAVVVNIKKSGTAESLPSAVSALAAEGEFRGLWKIAGKVDEELYRICKDAVAAAINGADPTGGAMNFKRLGKKAKADLRFDDSGEDAAQREMWCELGYLADKTVGEVVPIIIDGIGFY